MTDTNYQVGAWSITADGEKARTAWTYDAMADVMDHYAALTADPDHSPYYRVLITKYDARGARPMLMVTKGPIDD